MKEWTNYLSWPYGIQLSCVSLCMLYSDVKLNYKVKTLLAAHTGQNPAEAGFGQIRFMGGGNNDPNGMELMQRVTRWTIHRILKHDPDFDIMSLKEPLDQYIADLCNGKLDENGGGDFDGDFDDDFDYSQIPDDFNSDPANVVDQTDTTEQMYSKDGNDLIFVLYLVRYIKRSNHQTTNLVFPQFFPRSFLSLT